MHPFEQANLGRAPFRFVGIEERRGPLRVSSHDGVDTFIGSPGQPMGTCQYCGQGIAMCCTVKSADGKTFIVGQDCIDKIYRASNVSSTEKERDPVYKQFKAAKNAKLTAARHARWDAKLKELEPQLEKIRHLFAGALHPHKWAAERGETYEQYFRWMYQNCGKKRRIELIENAIRKFANANDNASTV